MVRLQDVYSLPPKEMSRGIVANVAAPPLRAEDLLNLAAGSKAIGLSKTALAWLDLAKTRAAEDNDGESVLTRIRAEEVNIYGMVTLC